MEILLLFYTQGIPELLKAADATKCRKNHLGLCERGDGGDGPVGEPFPRVPTAAGAGHAPKPGPVPGNAQLL